MQRIQIFVGVFQLVAAWQELLVLQDVADRERRSRVRCRRPLHREEAEVVPDDRTARRVVGPDGLGHGHAGHDRTLQEAHKAHSVCAAPERGLGAALRATTVRGLGAVRSRRTTKSGPRTSAGTRSM